MAHPGASDAFVEAVLDVVAAIPEGCARSYGEVAAILGSRAARQVGRIMAHHGHDVPWWRVVRASGQVAPGLEPAALEHYRREGTPLRWTPDRSGYRVDLRRARPLG